MEVQVSLAHLVEIFVSAYGNLFRGAVFEVDFRENVRIVEPRERPRAVGVYVPRAATGHRDPFAYVRQKGQVVADVLENLFAVRIGGELFREPPFEGGAVDNPDFVRAGVRHEELGTVGGERQPVGVCRAELYVVEQECGVEFVGGGVHEAHGVGVYPAALHLRGRHVEPRHDVRQIGVPAVGRHFYFLRVYRAVGQVDFRDGFERFRVQNRHRRRDVFLVKPPL